MTDTDIERRHRELLERLDRISAQLDALMAQRSEQWVRG